MKKLYRSICSTCQYVSGCTLTHAKGRVTSCSEYVHRLQRDKVPFLGLPLKRLGNMGHGNLHEEIVLNLTQ